MMPLDRMPSISLGLIVPPGAYYDSHHHWHSSDGVLNASVRFDAGGYSSAHKDRLSPCGSWPPPCSTPPTGADPPVPAAAVAEGVAG